ncbi:poly-gamma-glutamate system protein [Roseimaritima ulvae]|uniref:Poly-gamma-glutamate system protein n=1 Tax=Roseimaritima ulvae TaxID=980254 RepID=A0A5B9R030_9BACT|nr:poly-gamma-glutamate system protein [Roseimaritima ulvae]QEG43075.1 hypothetical protein UC8_51190 [Roseimaritima ulvae]
MNYQVLYWRPQRLSRRWLWCSLIVSLLGLALVQQWTSDAVARNADTLRQSAQKAADAMQHIGAQQIARGHRGLAAHDPQDSHLIGPSMSQVTTKMGALESKQTSVNANFAAIVTAWLIEAGVQPGDRIAIGASGSWPALNIAVYAAAETLQLRPTVVLSCGSSQYGANAPEMMWVDMERELFDAQLISFRATAVSLGGLHDRAAGMTDDSRALLLAAIGRNQVPLLATDSIHDSIIQRMELYERRGEGETYAAYINVGGGSASIGGSAGQQSFTAGLHTALPAGGAVPDCVASRMLERGVPILHVGDARGIADRYGLAIAPTEPPEVGMGSVYGGPRYRVWLVLAVMSLVWAMMVLTIAPRWWQSLWRRLPGSNDQKPTETGLPVNVQWMV